MTIFLNTSSLLQCKSLRENAKNKKSKTVSCFSYEGCGADTRACYELERSLFPVQDWDLGQLGHEF